MGIGYRIKEAREQLGLTQTELGKLVGVTGSAITNYEKETSHPKEQVIYKLIEHLNVDANYLFQDVVKIKAQKNDVTLAEYDMVKKYRALDEHGKKNVNNILDNEYDRCYVYIPEGQHSLCDDFTPEELEKMVIHTGSTKSEINEVIEKSKDQEYKTVTIDFGTDAVAAHNDHESESGEQEKMREDAAGLKRPE